MKKSLLALALGALMTHAFAADPKETITLLDTRLSSIGPAKIAEGREKAGEREAPVLMFGSRKINNNYDVVDEIKKKTGATATVFVRDGDEFIRVSTNILTPEGRRAVGTSLARAKAYEAVKQGQVFCGAVDVLGTSLDACYHPIKDASGSVVGVSYVGYKK